MSGWKLDAQSGRSITEKDIINSIDSWQKITNIELESDARGAVVTGFLESKSLLAGAVDRQADFHAI